MMFKLKIKIKEEMIWYTIQKCVVEVENNH